MTQSEKVVAAVLIAIIAAAFLLPAEIIDTALIVQIVVLGALAIIGGVYIWRVNRGLTSEESAYLWQLVRRDLRVMLGFASLAVEAVLVLIPRVLGIAPLLDRPWWLVWLVASIDLFAVGLIDDALVMRRDRRLRP